MNETNFLKSIIVRTTRRGVWHKIALLILKKTSLQSSYLENDKLAVCKKTNKANKKKLLHWAKKDGCLLQVKYNWEKLKKYYKSTQFE